jgi:hypothetical protein
VGLNLNHDRVFDFDIDFGSIAKHESQSRFVDIRTAGHLVGPRRASGRMLAIVKDEIVSVELVLCGVIAFLNFICV